MKAVILKGERYHYERAWPKAVKAIAPTNKYRMALNLPKGSSESEIFQAALIAQEDFEREVALLSNSSVEATSEALKERKTDDALAALGRMAGELDRRRLQIKTFKGDFPDFVEPKHRHPKMAGLPVFHEGVVWIPEGQDIDPEKLAKMF